MKKEGDKKRNNPITQTERKYKLVYTKLNMDKEKKHENC